MVIFHSYVSLPEGNIKAMASSRKIWGILMNSHEFSDGEVKQEH